MRALNATYVRNEWSSVVDSVIRETPKLIKRTHDYLFLSDINIIESFLSAYHFTAEIWVEDDNSVTLSLNEIDLVENGEDEQDAKLKLAGAILNYARDYYDDFRLWSSAPNRKKHIPYIFKALLLNDTDRIGSMIQCPHGKI